MDIRKIINSKILTNKNLVRLDKFINYALFSKDGYYYNKKPIGRKNDFITSPEISQTFGEIIGMYIFYIWKTQINCRFNFIELGPGNLTLFSDISRTLSKYPEFFNEAKISFIEINNKLMKIQKKNIKKLNYQNIEWRKKINFKSNKISIIYSNEFFDCFPVRQFIFKNIWFEKYVAYNKKDKFYYLKNVKVTNKKLLEKLSAYKKNKILELALERDKYFENICKFIKNNGGLLITIDYGYFENIKHFTLQGIQNHKFSHVLENLGEKDITSHVNFNIFLEITKKYNLKIEEFCSQRDFLIKYGILERKKKLIKLSKIKQIEIDINRLISKKEMGDTFKFLIVSNI